MTQTGLLARASHQRELWALAFLMVLVTSTYVVFVLPIPVDPWVKDAYDIIMSYGVGGSNSNKAMLVMSVESFSNVLECTPIIATFWNLVKKNGAYLVVMTAHVEMGQTQNVLAEMKRTWPGFPNVPEYGTQIVFLGWTPTTTMPVVWANLWGTYGGKDYFGNSLASLPMMNTFNPSHTLADYGVVVGLVGWEGFDYVQIHNAGVNTLIGFGGQGGMGGSTQLYSIGQRQGFVDGSGNGQQMELLSGIPGTNSLLATAPIMSALFIFGGVAVSNIWFATRRKEEKK